MPVQTKEPFVIEDTMWAIEKSASPRACLGS
jgi:hypothetical protein